MAAEDLLVTTTTTVNDLAITLGSLGRWMQALGLVVVLWILVQVVNFFILYKRMKRLEEMDKKLDRIERKVGKKKA